MNIHPRTGAAASASPDAAAARNRACSAPEQKTRSGESPKVSQRQYPSPVPELPLPAQSPRESPGRKKRNSLRSPPPGAPGTPGAGGSRRSSFRNFFLPPTQVDADPAIKRDPDSRLQNLEKAFHKLCTHIAKVKKKVSIDKPEDWAGLEVMASLALSILGSPQAKACADTDARALVFRLLDESLHAIATKCKVITGGDAQPRPTEVKTAVAKLLKVIQEMIDCLPRQETAGQAAASPAPAACDGASLPEPPVMPAADPLSQLRIRARSLPTRALDAYASPTARPAAHRAGHTGRIEEDDPLDDLRRQARQLSAKARASPEPPADAAASTSFSSFSSNASGSDLSSASSMSNPKAFFGAGEKGSTDS